MRIVTQVITVIATSILLVAAIWSIVIFTSPYEGQLIESLDYEVNQEDQTPTDARLYGTWQNAFQEVRFEADGSFDNEIEVDDEDAGDALLLKTTSKGGYEAKEEKLAFFVCDPDAASVPTLSFNYLLENHDNYLYLVNATHTFTLTRNINRVRAYEEMVNYSNEKVNISGLFEYENETNGYLTLNETEVLVFFGDYNETNFIEFDGLNVSIIGYLYLTCDCDYWEGPCVKDIELIELTK